tara:strand:- start:196 stop:357 length:162 start_codon:yes stop_codon:yes gene_type:complete
MDFKGILKACFLAFFIKNSIPGVSRSKENLKICTTVDTKNVQKWNLVDPEWRS